MFNEGNQIHNFMSSYGSGYGSGSTSQKVTVPTVPVPQHCIKFVDFSVCQVLEPEPELYPERDQDVDPDSGWTLIAVPGSTTLFTVRYWYPCYGAVFSLFYIKLSFFSTLKEQQLQEDILSHHYNPSPDSVLRIRNVYPGSGFSIPDSGPQH